jgi:hypothetical protein
VADERRAAARTPLEGVDLGLHPSALAGALRLARALALLLHEALEAPLIDVHTVVFGDLSCQVEGEAVGVVQLEGDLGRQFLTGIARAAQRLVEDTHALLEGAREARLLLTGLEIVAAASAPVASWHSRPRAHSFARKGSHTDYALLHGTTDQAQQHVRLAPRRQIRCPRRERRRPACPPSYAARAAPDRRLVGPEALAEPMAA